MLLQEAIRGEGFKASENFVHLLKAGSSHTLIEYGTEEEGNESKCYVAVSPGDTLAVHFRLRSAQLEFVDFYVDGILRYSSYNRSLTLKHSRYVPQVCQCRWRKSGGRGKLQIVDMVVKERTASKDAPGPSSSDNPSSISSVGTIEVRVLRKIPSEGVNPQAVRAATFEEHENWWTANTSAQPSEATIPSTYEIGFTNPFNGGSGMRKNIAENITGFYKWASFKFQYRSASELRSAGFNVSSANPSTSTSSNNHNNTANNTASDMNAITFPNQSYTAESPSMQENSTPFAESIRSDLSQNSPRVTSIKGKEPALQISPRHEEETIRHTIENKQDFKIVTPKIDGANVKRMKQEHENIWPKIDTVPRFQTGRNEFILIDDTDSQGGRSHNSVVSSDALMSPTQLSEFTFPHILLSAGTNPLPKEASESEVHVMKGLGILKDIRANETFRAGLLGLDEDHVPSTVQSHVARGLAATITAHQHFTSIGEEKNELVDVDRTQTGFEAFRAATAKSREPLKALAEVHAVSFQKSPTVLEHVGGGGIVAIPVTQPAPPNTPIRGSTPSQGTPRFDGLPNANFNAKYGLGAQFGDTTGIQDSSYFNTQTNMSSPEFTPPRNGWANSIDWSSPPTSQRIPNAASFNMESRASTGELAQQQKGKSFDLNSNFSFSPTCSKNLEPAHARHFDDSSLQIPGKALNTSKEDEELFDVGTFGCPSVSPEVTECRDEFAGYLSQKFDKLSHPTAGSTERRLHNADAVQRSDKRKHNRDDPLKAGYLEARHKKKRYHSGDIEVSLWTPEHTPVNINKLEKSKECASIPLSFVSVASAGVHQVESSEQAGSSVSQRSRKLQQRREALARAKKEIDELDRQIKEAEIEIQIEAEERKLIEELDRAHETIAAQQARLHELRG